MDLWPQVLSVAGLLAIILLVLAGAYFFTRWAGQNMGGGLFAARGGRIQVVKAGQRYLLLGSTPTGLTLLAELTREEGECWDPPMPPERPEAKRSPDFHALIQRLREKK